MNQDDRLLDALEQITRSTPRGISEWELIHRLDQNPDLAFEKPDMRDSWALFQRHFWLFHHLYLLKLQLETQGETLDIVATRIQRHSLKAVMAKTAPSVGALRQTDPMQAYYLDLDNLEAETPEGLQGKLDAFWNGLADPARQQEDWATLEIEPPASRYTLRQQYRRLCQRHHPDRGGSARRFRAVQGAYARLKPLVD